MTDRGFARGRLPARFSFVAASLFGGSLLAGTLLGSGTALAAPCAPATFTYDGSDWCKDRADTDYHNVVNGIGGRDGVLNLGIKQYTTTPPPPYDVTDFYETEGYKTNTTNPVGQTYVSGDLYIPASWQAQTASFASVGLWGTVGPNFSPAFPIVGFYNGAAGGGKIRYFDGGVGYVDAPTATINYDGWNTLRLNYLPGPTGATSVVEVVVNGSVVGTITGVALSTTDPVTATQYEIILNAHTNGLAAYDTYWSNITWALNEAYYDAPSVVATAVASGDMVLGTYVDRRGLDWDQQKASWMHVVAGSSKFDDGDGNVDLSVTGAQLGLDLVTLGDTSTRAGVTFGYSRQSASIASPMGDAVGSSTGSQPSIGAYITHSDSAFYADLLGQYRFLTFDVTAPTSTAKVTGGSTDLTAEAGAHIALGNGFTLTPFAQASYQHLVLGDVTLGGLDTSFGSSDALILRARLLAQAKVGGLSIFTSAGASTDVLGDKHTVVSGADYSSNIGGARAEFTAGLEGTFGGLSIFGSGEYDVSFDGNSQTYLGRAGFRHDF